MKHKQKTKDEHGETKDQLEYFNGYKAHMSLNTENGITDFHNSPVPAITRLPKDMSLGEKTWESSRLRLARAAPRQIL